MAGFGANNGPYVIQMLNAATDAFERGWGLIDETRGSFETALTAMADVELPSFAPPPTLQLPARTPADTTKFNDIPDIPDIPSGDLDYVPPTAPNYSAWETSVSQALSAVDSRIAQLGDFTSSVTISPIAPPGAPNPGVEPGAPSITEPAAPSEPVIVRPSLPLLTAIQIPGSPALSLPSFGAPMPAFEIEPPAPVGELLEPTYTSAMLTLISSKLTDMLGGKSGLPDAVEQALFDRARSREDILANKQVQEAMQTWSARGFSMPPGMLVAQVNAIQEENRLKGSAVNRDVYIKAQETLIQQLSTAIGAVLTLEQQMINLHNGVQQRKFEMLKLRANQAIAVYNAMVQAYGVRAQVYAVEANVYKTKIDAELAKLEIFRAEIDAQKLVGQINQQEIDVYRAQLEALKTDVDLYRGRIDAMRALVEVGGQRVQNYRAQIDAYGAKVNAERVKYDIYRAQVDAEIAKTNIIRAEADVYGAKIRNIEAVANIAVKKVDGELELARRETAAFVAEAEAERGRVASVSEAFRSQMAAYESSLRTLSISDERVIKAEDVSLREFDASVQHVLKQFDATMKKYDADQQRMIELSKMQQESARVMAQYATQIAAGAMSAVQMSIGATGSASSSEHWSVYQHI